MQKKDLKMTLLIMDIFVLLSIFIAVIFMFEMVIKNLLVEYSTNKFYESIRTTQFDLSNSMSYIEEKKELDYKSNALKVFEYIKLSTLKRAKYDNSIIAIIFPEEENLIIMGKRNDKDMSFDSKSFDFNEFDKKIKQVEEAVKSKGREKKYIDFNFKEGNFIGIAQYSSTGIRKNFERENSSLVKPIIFVADKDDEFFYLINGVERIFILILVIVFIISSYIKINNTMTATREIYSISNRMSQVSKEIRNTGIVGGGLKDLITKFRETNNLDNSFIDLVNSLESVGNIISGIADRELFIATLKNDNSLLNPHDEMMGIIFLDIQGFTTISEKHKENVMSIVNSIWMEVETVISKRYGKINKYEGDACLIIFRDLNNKSKNPTALNAFYAAIDIISLVPKLCNDLDITFKFRVGLDYGKVTYGKTGTNNNFELGVIGDTVNTAARLEALNKQYHTNFLLTDNAFQAAKLEPNKEFAPKNELLNEISIKCIMVDKARPRGKTEAKELYTVIVNNNKNEFTFIGSEKYFTTKHFDLFSKMHGEFINSIKYWQKYHSLKIKNPKEETQETITLKQNAQEAWAKIALNFAKFYHETKFPPADQFARLLLKFEEYEEFQKRPEAWLSKGIYNVKHPTEDWIKLGTIELEK